MIILEAAFEGAEAAQSVHASGEVFDELQEAALPQRERLARLVSRIPGIHMRELQRQLGLGWGTIAHHLRALERVRRIRLDSHGRHTHVYPAGTGATPEGLLSARGAAARIYGALAAGPCTSAGLALRLGISRQLVMYHLKRLDEAGFVKSTQDRPRTYARAR